MARGDWKRGGISSPSSRFPPAAFPRGAAPHRGDDRAPRRRRCLSSATAPVPAGRPGGSSPVRSLPTSWAAAFIGKGQASTAHLRRTGRTTGQGAAQFFPLMVSPTAWETLPLRSPAPGGDRSPRDRAAPSPRGAGGLARAPPGPLRCGKAMHPREAGPPLPRLRAAPGPCASASHGDGGALSTDGASRGRGTPRSALSPGPRGVELPAAGRGLLHEVLQPVFNTCQLLYKWHL